MADGVKGTLVAGVFAVVGALGGAAVTGWSQVQLAKQKFYSDLVLKALESKEPAERLATLTLLVETNLLRDPEIQSGVKAYAKAREKSPETIPQITQSTTQPTLATPLVSNARVYLLAGSPEKGTLFASYKSSLEGAGFRVLDSKILNDKGRPPHPEVRYFYAQDAVQAQTIADYVRFKLSDPRITTAFYEDSRVGPGYVEIWFGK